MPIAKKWGNSLGIILPAEIVKKQEIKEGDELVINVFKKGDLSDIFGTLKIKMPAQEFKDLARQGWESSSDKVFRLREKRPKYGGK